MKTVYALLAFVFATITIITCSVPTSLGQPGKAQAQKPPMSLDDVGRLGESLYDEANTKNWTKATENLKSLQTAFKQLALDLKGKEETLKRLDANVLSLGKSVPGKDVEATKRAANQVTLIAADLVEPFALDVPADVTRLDYYGRELEIWVVAKDATKLKSTAESMRKTWEKLQPAVKANGGNAEAARFMDLMSKVAAAKSVEDYGKLTTPCLDEVDNLEKVFTK